MNGSNSPGSTRGSCAQSGKTSSQVTQRVGQSDRTELLKYDSVGTHLPVGTLCDVKDGDHKPAGQKQGWSPGVLPSTAPMKTAQIPPGWSPLPILLGGLGPRTLCTSHPDQAPSSCLGPRTLCSFNTSSHSLGMHSSRAGRLREFSSSLLSSLRWGD